jgi:voltage-dependent potassium channel beta subunit
MSEMQYRKLGKSGLKLSVFSYGSWVTFGTQIDESLAVEMIKTAYDAGINFFDNAEVYARGQSEIIMGNALKKLCFSRDSFCVSSKVIMGGEKPTQRGLSFKHVVEACHGALKRLQVDYLDLYFCHRPDPDTPLEETVRAMHTLILQGKILYWGTSEWEASQIQAAIDIARRYGLTPPTMEQPEYNLFNRIKMEREYLDLFHYEGLGTTTWSPLASGLLTGKYNEGIPEQSRVNVPGYEWLKQQLQSSEGKSRLEKVKQLKDLADKNGLPLVNLALGWCLQNTHVSTVILGASRVEQLIQNLKTLDYLDKFTPELMAAIEEIVQTRPDRSSILV